MTQRRLDGVKTQPAAGLIGWVSLLAIVGLATLPARRADAEQPPPPCHPNPRAAVDRETVANRDDIRNLPAPLKERIVRLPTDPIASCPCKCSLRPTNPANCSST